ncbi:MAP kinase kinase (MEK) [Savitreella phatthalungensis]
MLATPTTMKRKNLKGLSLPGKSTVPSSTSTPTTLDGTATASIASNGSYAIDAVSDARQDANLSTRFNNLEIGIEFKVNIRAEDLKVISELGFGNGGTVSKVMHIPTRTIMARKVIKIEAKSEARKRILRELQIMQDCNSPFIIGFHGAFMIENDVHVCMEHMDCLSLDGIVTRKGKLPIEIVGKVSYSVVEGLTYLYDVHRIIHRDVKPSNVLVNSAGKIKLCDFGVSGELINSLANTFVGTSTYMSPERIQGAAYSVKGDVWSLGLMLVELATGQFPFGDRAMGVLDLLQLIVREPAPTLSPATFPAELVGMVAACLKKDPSERASLRELLNSEFVSAAKKQRVDVAKWAKSTQGFRKVDPSSATPQAISRRPPIKPALSSPPARDTPKSNKLHLKSLGITSATAGASASASASPSPSRSDGITTDGSGGGSTRYGGGGGRPGVRESHTAPDLTTTRPN